MTESIDVISLGIGELGEQAIQRLAATPVVIGSPRQLDLVQQFCPQAETIILPSPISGLSRMLKNLDQQSAVVLASGDGLFYGIGNLLIQTIGRQHLRFYPNVSSMQACMHMIGEPWQDASILSLHGRPGSALRRYLAPSTLLGIFTDQDNHPTNIAQETVDQGMGDATIWVGEALGTKGQAISCFNANDLAATTRSFNPLNLVVIKTTSTPGALPVFPGIPDQQFSTGAKPGFGMISKREVRLAILSFMQPAPGQIAWDIGAGCGSVCVEWARWNPRGKIYGVEVDTERVNHIHENARRFGVEQNCYIVQGSAPEQCEALPDPDCVFIGGSNGNLDLLMTYCHDRLRPGGTMVASAVTEASQKILHAFANQQRDQKCSVEWSEVAVRKNLPDSAGTRSLSPVQLIRCVKS